MVDVYSNYTYKHISHYNSSNSPSFSSTLLDAVYRSIDNGDEGMRKKQNFSYETDANVHHGGFKSDEAMANFQRACMIEKWMEKKASEKKKSRTHHENSSSSYSNSSYSSENIIELFPIQRPKPVRTSGTSFEMESSNRNRRDFSKKSKQESGFIKTKSQALKIYNDLKKVKQPISPGGKLAGFLNSIFTNGNSKRPKPTSNSDNSLKSATTSTCSSPSSFSRSCLSKTPSTGKSSNYKKRTVRFSPVSVILDEHCQPCGHKWLPEETNYNSTNKIENCSIRSIINEELMVHVSTKNRRVEELAKDLLRSYQNKVHVFDHEFVDEDEDNYDDAASCASSDLFELEHLSTIGMDKYRDELPVYATTHLNY